MLYLYCCMVFEYGLVDGQVFIVESVLQIVIWDQLFVYQWLGIVYQVSINVCNEGFGQDLQKDQVLEEYELVCMCVCMYWWCFVVGFQSILDCCFQKYECYVQMSGELVLIDIQLVYQV